jgi:hypothetical protein
MCLSPRFLRVAADEIPLSENDMVARADHGMIRSGERSDGVRK